MPFGRVRYWAIDFGCYRAATLALRNGANPYLLENLRKYADGASITDLTVYTYLPPFLLFILPLTWLPLHPAIRAWLILNLCILAGSVLLLSGALAWELDGRQFLIRMLGVVTFARRPGLLIGVATVGVLAVVIWVSARQGQGRDGPEKDRVFALSIAASLLTAGYVRTHDLVLLLVPFAILLNDARGGATTPRRRRIALAAVGLAYVLPYLLILLSLFALILRSAVFHISSTLSVGIGLLLLLWPPLKHKESLDESRRI